MEDAKISEYKNKTIQAEHAVLRVRWRLIMRALAALAVTLVVVFVGGFVWFAEGVDTFSGDPPPKADAIVALTGGANRISEALELLRSGHGQRLLITGVNPVTTRRALFAKVGESSEVACCVDIDHRARDTIGNAAEIGKWAESQGFRSLIVVTSTYHMPRSLYELERRLPDIALHPYPVSHGGLRFDRWYSDQLTTRVLFREYVKFILAHLRPGTWRMADAVPENSQIAARS